MSSETLLSAQLPVTILPPSTTLPSAPPTTPPTPFSATLTYDALSTTLTLTLSDLSTRLLLLSTSLTPSTYMPIRSAHSLRLDFPAFPSRLAELLLLPRSDPSYALQLHLPERDDAAPIALRLVQFNVYKAFLHIELSLSRASEPQLVAALAARAREAQAAGARADEAQRLADERQALLEASQAEVERLRAATAQSGDVRRAADDAQARLEETRAEIAGLRAALAQQEEKTRRAEDRMEMLLRETQALHAAAGTVEALREAVAEAERKAAAAERTVEEMQAGVERTRREVQESKEREERGRAEVRQMRAKGKVKSAVIAKQEAVVVAREKRVGALERELRRVRDRAAMLEVEKEGLSGRLSSAFSKLEENATVLRSDQQVIQYLSKELNERLAGGEWEEMEKIRGEVEGGEELARREMAAALR